MHTRRNIGPLSNGGWISDETLDVRAQATNKNAANVVLREIGLVLALTLVFALAVNATLAAMHIG
jgi:hypothetical protein